MSNKEVLTTVIKIPDSDIVVTRKVPMTEATCSELREIRSKREELWAQTLGEPVVIPYPTLIQQLIHEAYELQQEV